MKTKKTIKTTSGSVTTASVSSSSVVTTSYSIDMLYGEPILVKTIVNPTTIELIYIRHSTVTNGLGYSPVPKVYKEVYKISGKKKVVEGIYTPAQEESYDFN